MKMAKTRDFSKVIEKQLAADPKLRDKVEQHRLNFRIASLIYEERERAGLTQKELAELVGTHQSVIARLEDADYSGHSLAMLRRISYALGAELKVEFYRPAPIMTITLTAGFGPKDDFGLDISFGAIASKPIEAGMST